MAIDAPSNGPVPADAFTDPFRYLPPPIPFSAEMAAMAARYESSKIDYRYYAEFQAAYFLRPYTAAEHAARRDKFARLEQQVADQGFRLPDSLITLVKTDDYVDRLHHNTIWLELSDELWRLPSSRDKLMFLVFSEGQGCGHWHLLLSPDQTHCVVCCEAPFGTPSDWTMDVLPDFSKFEITQCADSFNEWLFHFFRDSEEDDRHYLRRLEKYFVDVK